MAADNSTAAVRVRSRRKELRRKIKRAVEEEEDSISSLPNVILQHILCFIPIKFAIRTSLLSNRWRHVWCDIPSLSLDDYLINKTLTHYTVPKMLNFHLQTYSKYYVSHIDGWIKFAMSRNVENLSLDLDYYDYNINTIPDSFYIISSIKQLSLSFHFANVIPKCSVSWTSLKKLSLRGCRLPDISLAKILSGCPILESLTSYYCELGVLNLSVSRCLKTLEIVHDIALSGPTQIVAPHLRFLRLKKDSRSSCTLADVSSLAEAQLDICFGSISDLKADYLQVMVLKMLEKLQNAEKLTLGGNFTKILSLAEIRGVPFPKFEVKTLNLETAISQYVIPGTERLIQNSPGLEKIIVRAREYCSTIPGEYLDEYLKLQGLNPDLCWRSKDGVFWNDKHWDLESKHVTSFVELMLTSTKTLDKMVLLLDERYIKFKIEELVPTLSHNNNVSIALSTDKSITSDDW